MARSTPADDDPGWGDAVRALAWALIPGMNMRRMRRGGRRGVNGLVVLRLIFVNFLIALALIGVVTTVLINTRSFKGNSVAAAAPTGVVVVVLGLVSLVTTPMVERPLDCATDATLLASYRTRFFLRIAMSEAVGLLGFVGFLLSGRWWLYALGAAFTAVGFARLAPTRANLARDQERLRTSGCLRSLVPVLAGVGPPGAGRRTSPS